MIATRRKIYTDKILDNLLGAQKIWHLPKLGEMETLVDGYIEALSSSLEPEWAREPVDGIRLVVGKDAKLFDAKRNDKATWLYLHQDCDKIVGDAFLCAEMDGELIGFTKLVAKTICEEFGIDMEDDAWKD